MGLDNSLYVGLSRQMTLKREMDIVANNIANQDTAGFKIEHLIIQEYPKAPAATEGGPKPIKFVYDLGIARDFKAGSMQRTGNPLDMAVEGDAFFTVNTPDGVRYTRDGRFTLDNTGRLVTQGGYPVVGEGGDITFDVTQGPIAVSRDGVISQGNLRITRLNLAQFGSLSGLEKTGDGFFRNANNQQVLPAPNASVHQGSIEGSNVNPIIEITEMIEVSRAYERMSKLIDQSAELSRGAVQRLGKTN